MGLLAALQFLTRVPIRLRREPSPTGMIPWFPVAGALIGGAVGGTAAGSWHVLPPLLAGACGVVVGLLVTGAFHEDGLGDVADAFGGGWTVERRLEILEDSRHGTYGVAAMCASIVLRVIALGSLPGPSAMLWSAVAAHALARGAAVGVMAAVPLARHAGLGADYGRAVDHGRGAIGVTSAVLVTVAAMIARFDVGGDAAVRTVALVLAAALGAGATAALARRKIGGSSGDVLGAVEQVVEVLALVVLAAR